MKYTYSEAYYYTHILQKNIYKKNTAARLFTLSRKCTHITPILKQLSKFAFKTIQGVSPSYLCSLVKPYEPLLGNMRSANMLLLTEHKSKNSSGVRSFTVSPAKAWNTLQNIIRASAIISVIKTALKTHLLKFTLNNTCGLFVDMFWKN